MNGVASRFGAADESVAEVEETLGWPTELTDAHGSDLRIKNVANNLTGSSDETGTRLGRRQQAFAWLSRLAASSPAISRQPVRFLALILLSRVMYASTMALIWVAGWRASGASWLLVTPGLVDAGVVLLEAVSELTLGLAAHNRSWTARWMLLVHTACLSFVTVFPLLQPLEQKPYHSRCDLHTAAAPGNLAMACSEYLLCTSCRGAWATLP